MASKPPTALSVKSVSKDFYLPHEQHNSAKSAIVNVFKKRDKSIDTQHALRDISFDIKQGEFFGILGRNGSGKSTMLKIIAQIYQPTTGSVSHKGKLVPFIELGVGFNPELTGRENVFLNGALLGFSRKEIEARYDEIVKFAELEDFMDQKLKNYSSGMQVRLAFSVATHAEADILVVDEVLAVGDADFQRKCYDYFKSLKKTGKTVVFVTHDMGAVKEYCDRAILIVDGVVAHEGNAEAVSNEYLKLFNQSETEERAESEQTRWGSRQIKMTNVNLQRQDDQLKLSVELTSQVDKSFESVVFGYRFIDTEEKLILGGNSLNSDKGAVKLAFAPHETKRLTFMMPNILGNGKYRLGAAIRLGDGVTILDDWSDITSITNTREDSFYPVVAPAVMEEK